MATKSTEMNVAPERACHSADAEMRYQRMRRGQYMRGLSPFLAAAAILWLIRSLEGGQFELNCGRLGGLDATAATYRSDRR
jgi:hypothetical protein